MAHLSSVSTPGVVRPTTVNVIPTACTTFAQGYVVFEESRSLFKGKRKLAVVLRGPLDLFAFPLRFLLERRITHEEADQVGTILSRAIARDERFANYEILDHRIEVGPVLECIDTRLQPVVRRLAKGELERDRDLAATRTDIFNLPGIEGKITTAKTHGELCADCRVVMAVGTIPIVDLKCPLLRLMTAAEKDGIQSAIQRVVRTGTA